MMQHRNKSRVESVLPRRGPPKAQPPGNAQAHVLRSLAISGERSRRQRPIHRRGAAPERALDLSGPKDRGAARTIRCGPVPCPDSQRGCDGPENTALRHPRFLGRQDHRFWRLGHAALLRLPTRRASRGAQGLRHLRRVPHVRGRPDRGTRARVFALRAGERRGQAHGARGRAVFLHAQAERRGHRRSDRLFPDRRLVPDGGQCRHARQGSEVAGRARSALRRLGARAQGSCHPGRAGTPGAGKDRIAFVRRASGDGASNRTILRERRSTHGFWRAPGTRGRTASRSCCRPKRPPRCGARWWRAA